MTLKSRSLPQGSEYRERVKNEVVPAPSGGAGEGEGAGERPPLVTSSLGVSRGSELGSESTDPPRAYLGIPRPILKWAGGKTKLLPELLARLPSSYGRFYEPFAGGAAMFFALAAKRAHGEAGEATRPINARWAVLGDANADLMATYGHVRDDVEAVIRILELYQRDHAAHGETQYYGARTLFNEHKLTPLQRAAALIYLNKTCFNGLWRVNRAGHFNVPMGSYKNPTICDAPALRAASRALAGADLRAGDYRVTVADAEPGDLVYVDPPYDGTFGAYTSETFDQRALAEWVRELTDRGVYVMASNADTPLVRSLYAGYTLEVVRGARAINSDGEGRGAVDELLIANFERAAVRQQALVKPSRKRKPVPNKTAPQIEIRPEFAVHMLNEDGKSRAADIAKQFSVCLNNLEAIIGADGREMALVRTHMQEAAFFAKRAMAMRAENQEPTP